MADEPRPPQVASETEKALFPNWECRLCNKVIEIPLEKHLSFIHPRVSPLMYYTEFPSELTKNDVASQRAMPPPEKPPQKKALKKRRRLNLNHPGGFYAADVEMSLADEFETAAFNENVQDLLSKGFVPGFLLGQTAYFMVMAGRIRMVLEERTAKGMSISDALKSLDDVVGSIQDGLKQLERERDQRVGQDTGLQTVNQALDASESWVESQIGEFTDQCPACRVPLTVPCLPHWAFAPNRTTDRGIEFAVWSPELWALVKEGVIPLWAMAYALRTSPEGLRLTARRRNEIWPDDIVLEPQETELRARLIADDRRAVRG